MFTNVPGKQTMKANLLLRFSFGGVLYSAYIYTHLLLYRTKDEYRYIFNLIAYTVSICSPLSL